MLIFDYIVYLRTFQWHCRSYETDGEQGPLVRISNLSILSQSDGLHGLGEEVYARYCFMDLFVAWEDKELQSICFS